MNLSTENALIKSIDPLKVVLSEEFRDVSSIYPYLEQSEPFVVKNSGICEKTYDSFLACIKENSVKIWRREEDFHETLRAQVESEREANCPCEKSFNKELVQSSQLEAGSDFQVVINYVKPESSMDLKFVQPLLIDKLNKIIDNKKNINLMNAVFLSSGNTRGVCHAHNYDVFAFFPNVGTGTRLYLFPVDFYSRLNAKVMRANGGLVNFDLGSVADDKLKDAAMTYEIQSGDIIYIPFGWFHRVDHRGQYINIATFWCFAEFLEKKLKVLKSKIPESDFRALFKSTLRLKYWRSRGAMLGFH